MGIDNGKRSDKGYKRYSVSLVYTKNLGSGNVNVSLCTQINYAWSSEESLGKAIQDFASATKGFLLTCQSVIDIDI